MKFIIRVLIATVAIVNLPVASVEATMSCLIVD